MNPCLENCVAIGRTVVYHAHAFSAEIKWRHCSLDDKIHFLFIEVLSFVSLRKSRKGFFGEPPLANSKCE